MKPTLVFQRRKARAEIYRVLAFEKDRHVLGLIGMLDSDVRAVTHLSIARGHAAAALGRLGDPRAVPHLVEMSQDPEESVRVDVMRALGKLQAREAEGALLEGLSDPRPLVRMIAASSLARVGAADAIPALRTVVESDPDVNVRAHAAEALLILGDETARKRVPEVMRALGWRARNSQWKRMGEAAESGEPISPWVYPWERES